MGRCDHSIVSELLHQIFITLMELMCYTKSNSFIRQVGTCISRIRSVV